MLVLIGATPEGKKELLGFRVGVRESAQSWRELLVDLKARGLAIAPELATGDGALGFWKALEAVFPATRHQRCWVHTIRTQLQLRGGGAATAWLGGGQGDAMPELQAAVADDDALDDQLQDGLFVGEAGVLQARAYAGAEGLQAGPHRL